jgi:hypothetical protein
MQRLLQRARTAVAAAAVPYELVVGLASSCCLAAAHASSRLDSRPGEVSRFMS